MVRLGAQGWELHPGTACAVCEPYPGLRDRLRARLFLQRFAKDPLAAEAIRHLLWRETPPWVMTKVTAPDATALMADLLSRGIWHVHAPPKLQDQGGGKSEAEVVEEDIAEIVQAPASSSEPAPRPAPPPEEGSLPRDADEAAIAAGMKLASLLGIPFCEECARAAMKRAQGAAVA